MSLRSHVLAVYKTPRRPGGVLQHAERHEVIGPCGCGALSGFRDSDSREAGAVVCTPLPSPAPGLSGLTRSSVARSRNRLTPVHGPRLMATRAGNATKVGGGWQKQDKRVARTRRSMVRQGLHLGANRSCQADGYKATSSPAASAALPSFPSSSLPSPNLPPPSV